MRWRYFLPISLSLLVPHPGFPEVDCPAAEAMLLEAVASNLRILGQYHEALAQLEAALTLINELEYPEVEIQVHMAAGLVNWALERHDAAIGHYLAALEISRLADERIGVARAAGNIGNL